MIELLRTVDTSRLETWLNNNLRSKLTADKSNYAKGRLKAWLRTEPMLFAPFNTVPGVECSDKVIERLAEIIQWQFDFVLVTFSGDSATGITPHRDAGFADYETYGLNINGSTQFDYWCTKESFGYAKETVKLNAKTDEPTHELQLQPGQVFRFNCKNEHSATPSAGRWGMNFWRRKIIRPLDTN